MIRNRQLIKVLYERPRPIPNDAIASPEPHVADTGVINASLESVNEFQHRVFAFTPAKSIDAVRSFDALRHESRMDAAVDNETARKSPLDRSRGFLNEGVIGGDRRESDDLGVPRLNVVEESCEVSLFGYAGEFRFVPMLLEERRDVTHTNREVGDLTVEIYEEYFHVREMDLRRYRPEPSVAHSSRPGGMRDVLGGSEVVVFVSMAISEEDCGGLEAATERD